MPTTFVVGALALIAGLFLVWRAIRAYQTNGTVFPFIEVRKVTKQSDTGSFWFAIAVQLAIAAALIMFSLPLI
jgi:hypothetical protein